MKRFPQDFAREAGVWVARPSAQTQAPHFDYSDGTDIEQRLLEILQSAHCLDSDSAELDRLVDDWPTRYHLGSERANLLRGLDLQPEARILELGGGCGAVTRWLGENSAHVTCLEGSAMRARIAAERCRDLPHVEVIADRIGAVQFRQRFDVVTCIGVLEYAAVYDHQETAGDPQAHDDAFARLLRSAHASLDTQGVLLLAIENKLGIKYLAGASEDHNGRRFSGIEGYADPDGPRTFGRVELLQLLRRCGFEDLQFLLPFPDYKIPTTLVNGDRTSARMARTCNLVDWCRQPYQDYSRGEQHQALFNEHLALQSFAANGLLADVANSFLVLASKTALTPDSVVPRVTWLARKINSGRKAAFRSLVTLEEDGDRSVVRKRLLRAKRHKSSKPVKAGLVTHHPRREAACIEGTESLSFCLLRALHRSQNNEVAVKELLEAWIGHLAAALDPQRPSTLPSRYVDCVPNNLLRDAAGQWHYVDDEWGWKEPVRLEWVLLRGLLQFWRENRPAIRTHLLTDDADFDGFVDYCMELTGLQLRAADLHPFLDQEQQLQERVLTTAAAAPRAPAPATPPTATTPER